MESVTSIVKNITSILNNHLIEITIHTLDDDECYLTVEKEGVAYSLFLNNNYAELAETYFNNNIGYNEKVIFQEESFDIILLTNKIVNIIDTRLNDIKKEVEYIMLLEEENNI